MPNTRALVVAASFALLAAGCTSTSEVQPLAAGPATDADADAADLAPQSTVALERFESYPAGVRRSLVASNLVPSPLVDEQRAPWRNVQAGLNRADLDLPLPQMWDAMLIESLYGDEPVAAAVRDGLATPDFIWPDDNDQRVANAAIDYTQLDGGYGLSAIVRVTATISGDTNVYVWNSQVHPDTGEVRDTRAPIALDVDQTREQMAAQANLAYLNVDHPWVPFPDLLG